VDVLIVEDDARLGKALQQGLRENRHDCTWIRNGRHGLDLARGQKFDVVILDLMLPDVEGLEILRTLRSECVQTPVLILTALGSVEERVTGLKTGADDYLIKPFAFPELLARLDVLCRRSAPKPSPVLEAGPLSLDLSTRRVHRGELEIDLSPTEFSVLEYLMRHAGHVVTRKMLSEHIWGENWEGVTNVIDVHINRLRSKLDRKFDDPLIHTVRGHGYVLRAAE
jgi:two-component system OmpR family response regulator/two-component system copper resistance phosphate regulon response regulator CusR